MTDGERPAWLDVALRQQTRHLARCIREPSPQRGDVRVLEPMDSDAPARIVLVVDVPPNDSSTAIVLLLSNVVENATDLDVLLTREKTDLPFDLIAESDVVGTAWQWQLERRLTRLPTVLVDGIEALPRLGDLQALSLLRGMPLSGAADVRWRWKEDEVLELQRLTADCVRTQLDAPTIDVGFLAADELPVVTAQRMALATSELAASGRAVLPPAAAAGLALDHPEVAHDLLSRLGPDAWLAMHELLIATIGDEVAASPARVAELPDRRVHPSRDPLRVAAGDVPRTLRVLTWSELWSDDMGGVVEIDVDGETRRLVRERAAA